MERQLGKPLHIQAAEAFESPAFLQKLGMARADAERIFGGADWHQLLRDLAPIRGRISCADALAAFRPLLDQVAPDPAEGWLSYAYQVARALLYPVSDPGHTSAQWDGALCFLQLLQVLFDAERTCLPFDFWLDFEFCTEEELSHSGVAEEYRRFCYRFREEYIYEMLRLSREVTSFRTLEHIAGVHYVSMRVARAFCASGGLIDLGLISGAALGHDLGKFGCKPGERVPYLHYYYTDQWFTRRGLTALGHIAANHSVWDLEIENLSSESLTLVYADFRVKQTYGEDRREIPCLYSLQEAFDVILSKLDNVDDAKRLRYRYVYAKLRDFEDYLISFGVDTTLRTAGGPARPAKNAALLNTDEVVTALRRTAVDHNIRLMHRLGHEQLFGNTLEAARGEKNPARLQAYVSIFEEYFTYWNASQKQQTLDFLYELLLIPDGDIRRRAAALIGRILAAFRLGYQKEPPADAPPDPEEDLPFQLWAEYLEKLIDPDRRLTPRQISMIRYQAKTAADALLMNCSDADAPRFAGELFRHYGRRCGLCPAGHGAEPAAGPGIRRGSARADRLFRLVAGTGRPAPEGRRPAAVPPPADGPGPQWPGRRGHHCRRGGSGLPGKHAAAVSPGPPGRAAGPGCLHPAVPVGPAGRREQCVSGQPEDCDPLGSEGRGRGVPAGSGGTGRPRQRAPHRHPLLQPDEGQ